MTWDALLNILLAVVVPGLMALIGGVLAAKALPPESQTGKVRAGHYIAVFVFLFLVSVALAFVQQTRSTSQQRAADDKAAQAELKSTSDIKYMQGQLDTMNRVLATVAANSDPKQLTMLLKGSVSNDKSTLKKRTLTLCSEIETWYRNYPKAPVSAVPGKQTPKEQQDFMNWLQGYWKAYAERFTVQALSIVQEYGSKGFDVRSIERGAEYGNLPDDLVTQLRAFANQLDANGNRKQ